LPACVVIQQQKLLQHTKELGEKLLMLNIANIYTQHQHILFDKRFYVSNCTGRI